MRALVFILISHFFYSDPGETEAGENIKNEQGKNVGRFQNRQGIYGLGLLRLAEISGTLKMTTKSSQLVSLNAEVPNWWPRVNSLCRVFIFNLYPSLGKSADEKLEDIFFFLKIGFDISCKSSPNFYEISSYFNGKCQVLFSGKYKMNISKCLQLNFYPACKLSD